MNNNRRLARDFVTVGSFFADCRGGVNLPN
jgi:hypothetical protein